MKLLDELLTMGGRKFMLTVLALLLLTLWRACGFVTGGEAISAFTTIIIAFFGGNIAGKFAFLNNNQTIKQDVKIQRPKSTRAKGPTGE
jgi:hypothetical protein